MAHAFEGIGGLAPDVCTRFSASLGLLKGADHELWCTKKQRRDQGFREGCGEEEEGGWFCDGYATPHGTNTHLNRGAKLSSPFESRPMVVCIVSLIRIPLHVLQKTTASLILPLLWSGQREVLCCNVQDLVLCEGVYVCLCGTDHAAWDGCLCLSIYIRTLPELGLPSAALPRCTHQGCHTAWLLCCLIAQIRCILQPQTARTLERGCTSLKLLV